MNHRLFNKANRNKTTYISDINVTPFVDVLLVLLIVFMIAAPILTGSVDVDLPKGDTSKQIKDDSNPVVISINKNGEVILGEENIKLDKIKSKLIKVTENNFNQKIYIRGDKAVDYGLIMNVIKKINESGFSKVILVTNISQ